MAVNVETLDKLERKMTLTLPKEPIQAEIAARLRKLARTVKMDGFRPGKVPLNMVEGRYGFSVQYEVMNDKVGEAFYKAAAEEKLRIAGEPAISEKEQAANGEMVFEAIFEVFPEVKVGDLSSVEVKKLSADVTEASVNNTVDILRKQRRTFALKAKDSAVADGDRVSIDFVGKIDGEAFDGGKAEDFRFVVGEGQMLKEFEDAVLGMKVGESKTFPLSFPEDYMGRDVAGKTADFMVTLHKIEASHLPELDEKFIKSLGVESGLESDLRADIEKNLAREIRQRLSIRNKRAAVDALVSVTDFDLPQAVVKAEIARLISAAKADMKARGLKDADKLELPEDTFREDAEKQVRMGLAVSALVQEAKLDPTQEQIKAQLEDISASYESPADVVKYYESDKNRMATVHAMVIENNVAEYIWGKAKVIDEKLGFDELMKA